MLHPLVRPGWVRSAGPTLGVAAGSAGPVHLEGRGGGAVREGRGPGTPRRLAGGPHGTGLGVQGAAAAQRAPFTGEDRGRAARGPAGVGGALPGRTLVPGRDPAPPASWGGGRRKDAGPAGRCAPPERLDDAGEPGQLAFFYPLFGVSVQYLKVCSGVGASYWLIQVCDFSPLGYIKVCNQVGGTWRSFYWVNERRRG